ncbi:MAG: hypothetical protein ACFCVK_19990 [Acidimicrobiales bacterium]
MATWFTADLHVGHRNIIEYCNRPFADVDAMNRALVDNWNEVVAHDDTVWVVGDFALGKIAETLPIAGQLNGHKILLAGNHDRCWTGHGPRAEGWTERYLEAGFDEVVDDDSATVTIGDRAVLACHFPYRGDSHGEDRFIDHRPVDDGGWMLHGHVHERWAQHGRMINVGVDVTGFRPIGERAVAGLIDAGPTTRAVHDRAMSG